jgi:hypothetical protein
MPDLERARGHLFRVAAQAVEPALMFLSFLLWGGLVLIVIALPLLMARRTRRVALVAMAIAPIMIIAAFAWPVRDAKATGRVTHLDQLMPLWQFAERHATRVSAPPERVFAAIREVTPNEILLFRTLTTLRRLGRPAPPNILNAPENEPLLHLATRTSFRYLADDPPHEIVVGTIIIPPRAAVATMNFLVTPDGHGGSLLSTETRVVANTADARRRFSRYWRVILPGSDVIRRMWLRAIKKRAEKPQSSALAPRSGERVAGGRVRGVPSSAASRHLLPTRGEKDLVTR